MAAKAAIKKPPYGYIVDVTGSEKCCRATVVCAIFNRYGQVLVGRRKDETGWQFVQGGIDKGEDIGAAGFREIAEEAGLAKMALSFLGALAKPIYYDYPPGTPKGRFFNSAMLMTGIYLLHEGAVPNPNSGHNGQSAEFDEFAWVDVARLAELASPKKTTAYQELSDVLQPVVDSITKASPDLTIASLAQQILHDTGLGGDVEGSPFLSAFPAIPGRLTDDPRPIVVAKPA